MGSGEGSGWEGVGNGSKAVRARGLVAKLEMYSSQPPPFTFSPLHIALSTDDNLVVVLQGHSNTAQALQPPLVRASQRHHQAPSTHSHQPHQLDQYRLGIFWKDTALKSHRILQGCQLSGTGSCRRRGRTLCLLLPTALLAVIPAAPNTPGITHSPQCIPTIVRRNMIERSQHGQVDASMVSL
jgi:hypothetical protein